MKSTTFVSCLFNCHDKTEYKSKNYYYARSLRTLLIDKPFVIYCDPEYVKKFTDIRIALGYEHITKIIPMKLEEVYLYKYLDNLTNNDIRANKQVNILWASKSELLLMVLTSNPFNTTHFAWIDINHLSKHPHESINYMKPDIYDRLHEIAENPQDKFAITAIGCWTKDHYKNLTDYYKTYPYIVSGGFYTMDFASGLFILPKIMEIAETHIKQGFCKGDEPLYAPIIDTYESKFSLLLGDYQDTIHNYYSLETNHKYINNNLVHKYKNLVKTERLIAIINGYKSRDILKKYDYDTLVKI